MKECIHHPVYGEIVYNENFWTGRKAVSVNGVKAKRVSKKEFSLNEEKLILNGSVLTGAVLCIGDETIQISPKPKWYEVVLAILPFLVLMFWGNNATLYFILPVVSGALGGGLGGLGSAISLLLMKKVHNVSLKVLIGIGMIVCTLFAAFIPTIVIILLFP